MHWVGCSSLFAWVLCVCYVVYVCVVMNALNWLFKFICMALVCLLCMCCYVCIVMCVVTCCVVNLVLFLTSSFGCPFPFMRELFNSKLYSQKA